MLFRSRAIMALSLIVLMLGVLTSSPANAHHRDDHRDGPPPWANGHGPGEKPKGDPWPTGNEWPEEVTGPFEIKKVHQVVEMDDRVELNGWLWLPQGLPAGLKSPVVLWFSPYHGNVDAAGNRDSAGTRLGNALFPARQMAEAGYAIAFFSARGTGDSGGCFDWAGTRSAKDGAQLVEWLAAQSWSNGRVGMVGQSGDASLAWATATEAPRGLMTIVPQEGVIDTYTWQGSPQGYLTNQTGFAYLSSGAFISATPTIPVGPDGPGSEPAPPDSTVRGIARDRLCPTVQQHLATMARAPIANDRGAAFWDDHRFTEKLTNVEAAVLNVTGFKDVNVGGFGPDALAWPLLQQVPQGAIHGQWDHAGGLNPALQGRTLNERQLTWFDFWLKGLGEVPPEVGAVEYQTDGWHSGSESVAGEWSVSNQWPPQEASDEVLYLGSNRLLNEPNGSSASFKPTTRLGENFASGVEITPCLPESAGTLFESAPVTTPVKVAGVPFAYLRLKSDQVGGRIGIHVFELGKDFSCDKAPNQASLITWGGADLRFLEGNFVAEDFLVGTETNIRIDLETMATEIDAGNRIGILVSGGEIAFKGLDEYAPTLTLLGTGENLASHVVLPVVDDPSTPDKETLGGHEPLVSYPARPFAGM